MSNKTSAKKGQGTKKTKGEAPAEVLKSPQVKLPAKMGRPTTFTQDLADEICERLAIGESVRTVCKADHMPAISTFFKWLRERPDFSEQYTRAKQEAADAMAEDILDISDDGTNDWMEVQYGDYEGWKVNGEALQRSKLRVDTRKWLMAKMKPRVYGDKIDMTSDGKALPQPILAMLNTKNEESNTKADVIEGEIVKEVPENTAPDQNNQSGTIMDDING